MAQTKGLGRGLSSLFSEAEEDYGKSLVFSEAEDKGEAGVSEIELSQIHANPNQPRKVFDETALRELSSSISKHGVIMPIIVNKDDTGYMIIAGERRYRASKLAGLTKVPVIIKNYNERQIKEISLIENLQREDLNPIEAASAMNSLMQDYSLTQEELADRIGKSRPAIANTLRLLSLSENVKPLVASGSLTAGHARALLTLSAEEQEKCAKKIAKEGLSVRDTEKLVKTYLETPEERAQRKLRAEMSIELREMVQRMQRVFGTKVNAIGNDNKGRIYLDYYSRDDLDRISMLLDELDKH